MTTPERGLFERIEPFLESLHPNSAWRNRIKAEIEKFEQRLAEAEQEVRSCQKDRVDLEVSFCKSSVEKNEEITQLRARCGELERVRAERDHHRDLFELVGKSVCAALERAGFDSVDDPGESIDVLAEDRNGLQQILAQKDLLLTAINNPYAAPETMRSLAQKALALTTAPQPAQQDECTRAGKHDWGSITGGMSCYKCGTPWWANTPEPKPAQEPKP